MLQLLQVLKGIFSVILKKISMAELEKTCVFHIYNMFTKSWSYKVKSVSKGQSINQTHHIILSLIATLFNLRITINQMIKKINLFYR